MANRTPIIVANWKMNKLVNEAGAFVESFKTQLAQIPQELGKDYEVGIAPPATHLTTLISAIGNTPIYPGAQNGGPTKSGAFTGEVSPVVLKEIGCQFTLTGHSERRHVFGEDNALVLSRTKAALEEGLSVILCVGELIEERKAGNTFKVVEEQLSILCKNPLPADQLKKLVLAYEPVWAIGTGEVATPEQAQEVHAFIRNWYSKNIGTEQAAGLRIQYGGSVKPDNAKELMGQPDLDGFLVGGASLDPTIFANLIKNGLESCPD